MALAETLRDEVLRQTKNNPIFLASLTVNALNFEPSLGFFRPFVLEQHGSQTNAYETTGLVVPTSGRRKEQSMHNPSSHLV